MVQVSNETTVKEPTMLDRVMTMKPTPRVERMREAFLRLERSASIDRARIEARVMRETVGEPMITRRSKVFAAVLREMPIDICPDELIVGLTSVRPLCANVGPGAYAMLQQIRANTVGYADRTIYPGLSDEEVRELEEDLAPYWKQQGRVGRVVYWHYGHNIHGMEKVVKKGFLGIKKEAEERSARLDLTEPEDLKKLPFLEGAV